MLIKVFSLNCWGIHFPVPWITSPDRRERITAIANYLKDSDHTFAFLQEVWSQDDYDFIKESVKTALPYSHYFLGGVAGSGTCILSKYELRSHFYHQFAINGYPHQVWFGDGLAGAGVGLVTASVEQFEVVLGVTHFHAEYDMDKMPFLIDRAMQALDTVDLVKTVGNERLFILAGDFNSIPGSLPYRIMTSALIDSDSTRIENRAPTWSHPQNSYRSDSEEPVTLDYIFYKPGGCVVQDSKHSQPLTRRVDGKTFSYSDHEGIEAILEVDQKTEISTDIQSSHCTEGDSKPEDAWMDETRRLIQDQYSKEFERFLSYCCLDVLIVLTLLLLLSTTTWICFLGALASIRVYFLAHFLTRRNAMCNALQTIQNS